MNTIPESIYENLTIAQRVAAAVAAGARDDNAEIARLTSTCCKRTFLMTDPDYTDRMLRLTSLSIAHECTLRGIALSFFASRNLQRGNANATPEERNAACDVSDNLLSDFASHVQAMAVFAESEGIDADALEKFGLPPHPIVKAMMTLSAGEADPELVTAYADQNRRFFQGELT